jgi:carboxylesterase type B
MIRLAEAQGRHCSDVWMYRFEWKTPVLKGRLGSPHALDLPFFTGNLDAPGVAELTGSGAERRALSDRVKDALIAFARDGDPNHAELPAWPPYEPQRRTTMIFDTVPHTRDDPSAVVRRAWDSLPFDGLRPAIRELPRIGDIALFYRRRWRIMVASACALLLVSLLSFVLTRYLAN